ncbi:NAD+ synthase [bacterium]|nr:NAD+ synthase [bacterium]MBU1753529.1 NAD+ synthase [bacterium]
MLRIGMAQINPIVGDLKGNGQKIIEYIYQAKEAGVDILSFPELAICGYPPEDLVFKPHFVEDNIKILEKIIKHTKGITIIVGFIDTNKDGNIYNAAGICHNQNIAGVYHKMNLPNYGVFDEKRHFEHGQNPLVFILNQTVVGINICEDIWIENGPVSLQTTKGRAKIIMNISASPYHVGKGKLREKILAKKAIDNSVVICYNNLVGGQDELIFDGGSIVIDQQGDMIAHGKQFEEDLIIVDLSTEVQVHKDTKAVGVGSKPTLFIPVCDPQVPEVTTHGSLCLHDSVSSENVMDVIRLEGTGNRLKKTPHVPLLETKRLDELEEIYHALVLGTHDYVHKNGFRQVIIGLSGGIDSALVAAIAVDALGSENVVGISMPSQYSSQETQNDAQRLAENLGIGFHIVPIMDIFETYLKTLKQEFISIKKIESLLGRDTTALPVDVTEENLQARIRGNIIMAFSNKFGYLALTTGNKSEMGVGYCTLYGDMSGGFAVIKDVPKTLVYKLAQYRNDREIVIPLGILTRPPSAELKEDQKDEDTLPPYEILDSIIETYVEKDKSSKQVIALGFEPEVVRKIIQMVDTSEYKRRQSPPGVKITPKAFGRDRRLPITNKYVDW